MTLSCYKSHKHQITKFIVRFIVIQRRFCTDIRLINSYKLQNSTMVLYSYFFYCVQPICKVLIILQLYLRSATYFWMFVEGLNILVPLRHSFQGKIRMSWFYFIGWGVYFFSSVKHLVRFQLFYSMLLIYNFFLNIYERCV